MGQAGILGVFARSPIRPLQRHMAQAHACAEQLPSFFEAVLADDWDRAAQVQAEISENEHQADILKMDFRLHVPKKIFLPVSRADLLALLAKQELIANISEDIAGTMLGRKMKIPESIASDIQAFLQRSVEASAQAKKTINELDELLESGFMGREVEFVDSMVKELSRIESDTDRMQVGIRQKLFQLEQTLPPVDVMFLYKVIEWIGLLADCAQQAGERLQMLAAE